MMRSCLGLAKNSKTRGTNDSNKTKLGSAYAECEINKEYFGLKLRTD